MAFKDNIYPQISDKISSLGDRPNAPTQYGGNSLSADSLKARFDALPNMAIAKLNEIISAYNNGDFAASLTIKGGAYTTLQAFVEAVQNGNLAEAIKVDSNDSGESDNEYDATLQAVLTTLLTKAKSLETDIADGALAENIVVGGNLNGSKLKAILETFNSYIGSLESSITDGSINPTNGSANGLSARLAIRDITEGNTDYPNGIKTLDELVKAITDGTLSQLLTVMRYNEPATAKPLTEVFDMISDIDKDVKRIEKEVDRKIDGTLYRYKGTRISLPDPTNGDKLEEGYVYNIVTENGEPFIYNGVSYPSGTNMAYIGNEEWDALGGLVDFSGGSDWDLIITNTADLKNKLPSASGNVLVKIDEPIYEDSLKLTLGYGLKLLDFGHTTIDGVDEITAQKYARTVIRNLMADNYCTLKNFAVVENCNSYIDVESCQEVRGCKIHSATSCTNVHDCVSDIEAPYSVSFTSCDLINNITITSIEKAVGEQFGAVEFSDCHHISNIHCKDNDGHDDGALSQHIHYSNCTFVDPYTCAGYVQPENSGKVPVPDSSGGVEFKDVATKTDIGNIEEALRIINEGGTT